MSELILKREPPIESATLGDRTVDVLRLDLIDPYYGGNKFYKLKHNLQKAIDLGLKQIITFGGAHSNHLYSSAAACKAFGIQLIAVVRGEERMLKESPTLQFVKDNGATIVFVNRQEYREKHSDSFISQLKTTYGPSWIVPEGGNNAEGVQGCMEILDNRTTHDLVFCACGTAATFTGIYLSSSDSQRVIGISVLKGENSLIGDANRWIQEFGGNKIVPSQNKDLSQSTILNDYHLGGYAAFDPGLADFKKMFEQSHNMPLDHVYTAKLFYAVNDLIRLKKIKASERVLLIHSGGQQGNTAFEKRYQATPIR